MDTEHLKAEIHDLIEDAAKLQMTGRVLAEKLLPPIDAFVRDFMLALRIQEDLLRSILTRIEESEDDDA